MNKNVDIVDASTLNERGLYNDTGVVVVVQMPAMVGKLVGLKESV